MKESLKMFSWVIVVECFIPQPLLQGVRLVLTSCAPQTAGIGKSLSTACKSHESGSTAKWAQPAVNHIYNGVRQLAGATMTCLWIPGPAWQGTWSTSARTTLVSTPGASTGLSRVANGWSVGISHTSQNSSQYVYWMAEKLTIIQSNALMRNRLWMHTHILKLVN